MMQKEMLYVAPFFSFPPQSGADLRAIHLAEQLSIEWQITLLIRKGADTVSEMDNWAKKNRIQIVCFDCPWKSLANNKFARLFAPRPPGFFALDPTCVLTAVETVFKTHGHFDLIFLATQLAGQILLRKKLPVPTVVDFYDLYTLLALKNVAETSLARPYHWLYLYEAYRVASFEHQIVNKSSLCLIPSQIELEYAKKKFHNNWAFIPNGAGLPQARSQQTLKNQILMVGSLWHKPNMEGFMWFYELVWPKVIKDYPESRLCLVGSGQELLPPELKLNDNLVLAGVVPDLSPYYEKSVCALVPILRGGGTRLKLLEAMAWGIPVVSTSAGCAGVAHQGTILLADDPDEFASHLLACLCEPARFATKAEKARQVIAENYTWDRIGQKLRGHLTALLETT